MVNLNSDSEGADESDDELVSPIPTANAEASSEHASAMAIAPAVPPRVCSASPRGDASGLSVCSATAGTTNFGPDERETQSTAIVSESTCVTISDSEDSVRALCTYLSDRCGVSFCEKQGQGHTALHKAAHRGNKHVVECRFHVGNLPIHLRI